MRYNYICNKRKSGPGRALFYPCFCQNDMELRVLLSVWQIIMFILEILFRFHSDRRCYGSDWNNEISSRSIEYIRSRNSRNLAACDWLTDTKLQSLLQDSKCAETPAEQTPSPSTPISLPASCTTFLFYTQHPKTHFFSTDFFKVKRSEK
jgi:hypothetical protein